MHPHDTIHSSSFPPLSFFLSLFLFLLLVYLHTGPKKEIGICKYFSIYIYINGHVIYLIARERERERYIRPLYHTPSFCIYKPPKSPKLFPFYLPICLFVYLLICLFAYLVVGNWWANTSKIKDCCPPLM